MPEHRDAECKLGSGSGLCQLAQQGCCVPDNRTRGDGGRPGGEMDLGGLQGRGGALRLDRRFIYQPSVFVALDGWEGFCEHSGLLDPAVGSDSCGAQHSVVKRQGHTPGGPERTPHTLLGEPRVERVEGLES